ncbi:hypothetical protein E2C01_068039 [Portunus trituberculatus]|uniref:Uncharacterized protein n=1 Tax=Portunus trituberculatus TaxID=210409 RepID=A0A5B7HQY3_PORTR|nr:hypothetical protein [Portunus trituberculatus]
MFWQSGLYARNMKGAGLSPVGAPHNSVEAWHFTLDFCDMRIVRHLVENSGDLYSRP